MFPRWQIAPYGDARDEWLRHIEFDRQRKASTLEDYRGQSRRYLLDLFGADTPLDEITTERIEEWQQELLEAGQLSRRTIQKAQVMLHAIRKRAKKKGWVERNAAEDADRITLKPSGDFNVLSPDEAETLVRAASDDCEAALYRVAIGAGLRMGELRALAGRRPSGGASCMCAGRSPGISSTGRSHRTCAASRWPTKSRSPWTA